MESVASMGKLFGRRRKAVSGQSEKNRSLKRPLATEPSGDAYCPTEQSVAMQPATSLNTKENTTSSLCSAAARNAEVHSASLQPAADQLNLLQAEVGRTYIIKDINTTDPEMNAFLFRLGCYSGEPITLISKKRKSCIVAIKDSRYGLDNQLAEAVVI